MSPNQLISCYTTYIYIHTDLRFPELGVPLNQQFYFSDFPLHAIQLLGYPHDYGSPYIIHRIVNKITSCDTIHMYIYIYTLYIR